MGSPTADNSGNSQPQQNPPTSFSTQEISFQMVRGALYTQLSRCLAKDGYEHTCEQHHHQGNGRKCTGLHGFPVALKIRRAMGNAVGLVAVIVVGTECFVVGWQAVDRYLRPGSSPTIRRRGETSVHGLFVEQQTLLPRVPSPIPHASP
jgi:hypothetical protein